MDVRTKLKLHTQKQHAQIEGAALFKKITKQDFSIHDYICLLEKLYGFVVPMETKMAGIHPHFAHQFSKRAFLENDLVFLGKRLQEVMQLKQCTVFPPMTSLEHVLGYLYVQEGATLGGQYISTIVRARLRLGPDRGLSYFYGHGKSTAVKWRTFCCILNQMGPYLAHDEIIRSAIGSYEKLYSWLEAK